VVIVTVYWRKKHGQLRTIEVNIKVTLQNEVKCRVKKVRITKGKCYWPNYQVEPAGKLWLFVLKHAAECYAEETVSHTVLA
jgi:hypothetical protein